MKKETNIKEFQKMYNAITDPEERAKARRETDKKKRSEEKRIDTGL